MARLTHTFFLLCIGCVLASVLALQPPDPASAFTSGVTIQVSDFSSQETYYGTMFHDTSRRAQLIDVPDDSYVRLQRWDLVRNSRPLFLDPFLSFLWPLLSGLPLPCIQLTNVDNIFWNLPPSSALRAANTTSTTPPMIAPPGQHLALALPICGAGFHQRHGRATTRLVV